MIGNNMLRLNQATVMAALQHYFDTIVFKECAKIKVTSIKEVDSSYFNVNVLEGEPVEYGTTKT